MSSEKQETPHKISFEIHRQGMAWLVIPGLVLLFGVIGLFWGIFIDASVDSIYLWIGLAIISAIPVSILAAWIVMLPKRTVRNEVLYDGRHITFPGFFRDQVIEVQNVHLVLKVALGHIDGFITGVIIRQKSGRSAFLHIKEVKKFAEAIQKDNPELNMPSHKVDVAEAMSVTITGSQLNSPSWPEGGESKSASLQLYQGSSAWLWVIATIALVFAVFFMLAGIQLNGFGRVAGIVLAVIFIAGGILLVVFRPSAKRMGRSQK